MDDRLGGEAVDDQFARPFLGRALSPAKPDTQAPSVEQTAAARPYLMTGGRTKGDIHIPVETLVVAAAGVRSGDHALERRQIIELADTAIGVAELSSLTGLPLGVIRVLVADLVAAGALIMSTAAGATTNHVPVTHDVATLERLIHGFAAI
ncbi:DUF742 domain-containing protein [Euzebya tangerina]|uniref:DUF742 domain-containing protein n=1 Tax=Euzebya tangerina TaxID=591198 RepID=UPI000E312843|nr:DUF742 domain-containing protein [Euzebya tangerina]